MIDLLFSKGKSFSAFPVKLLYVFLDDTSGLKAGVTVSSRNFKKAVDRNRVKRILRECYRLQKATLEQSVIKQQKSVILFLIYSSKELPVYTELYEKIKILLGKLNDKLNENKAVENNI